MFFRKPKKQKGIITERRQLEQILQHLAIAVEQMTEGIAVVDPDGIVHFINTAWAKMHGYEDSSYLLEKQIDTFYAKKAPMGRVAFCLEQARKTSLYCATQLHKRNDGSTFPTRTKVMALRDETGQINGFMIFALDITKAALIEEELTDTSRRAEQLKSQLQDQSEYSRQKQNELQQRLRQIRTENLKLQQQVAIQSETQQQWEQRHDQLDNEADELLEENSELQSKISMLEDAEISLTAMVEQLTVANEQMQLTLSQPEFDVDTFDAGNDCSKGLGNGDLFDTGKIKALADFAKKLR